MKKTLYPYLLLLGFLGISFQTYAQEEKIEVEDSAEVFLEEYSDDFQDMFFEALKQKGIENYDRAINLLLECKLLNADNRVIDHELAKVYFANKEYLLAQEYSIVALESDPTNFWYLNTLIEILQKQGNSINTVKSSIQYKNEKLKENLALIYFRQKNYTEAQIILKDLKNSPFTESLASKINDSIESRKQKGTPTQLVSSSTPESTTSDPLQEHLTKIKGLIVANDIKQLEQFSTEALESYPSQPYFYYAQGFVLNKTGKHKDAIELLETGLDYIIDNVSLSNDIYKELADAYNAINNSVKANMYLRKIKPGF